MRHLALLLLLLPSLAWSQENYLGQSYAYVKTEMAKLGHCGRLDYGLTLTSLEYACTENNIDAQYVYYFDSTGVECYRYCMHIQGMTEAEYFPLLEESGYVATGPYYFNRAKNRSADFITIDNGYLFLCLDKLNH